eukprot:3388824-Pyramimonas_sp.AAC.1
MCTNISVSSTPQCSRAISFSSTGGECPVRTAQVVAARSPFRPRRRERSALRPSCLFSSPHPAWPVHVHWARPHESGGAILADQPRPLPRQRLKF